MCAHVDGVVCRVGDVLLGSRAQSLFRAVLLPLVDLVLDTDFLAVAVVCVGFVVSG